MASAAKDEKYDFDLFTIGGGTGGVRAARFAASDYGELCNSSHMLLLTWLVLRQADQQQVEQLATLANDHALVCFCSLS